MHDTGNGSNRRTIRRKKQIIVIHSSVRREFVKEAEAKAEAKAIAEAKAETEAEPEKGNNLSI